MFSWKIVKASGFFIISLFFLFSINQYNKDLFIIINKWSLWEYAYIFHYITFFGDGIFIVFVLILYVTRPGRFLAQDGPIFIQGILIFLISGIIVQFLKHVFMAPRPAAVLAIGELNIIGNALYFYSFPSGHSASIFGLITFLNIYLKKIGRLRFNIFFLWIIAWVVGISRIIVGAHWPIDVFFGAWIGYSTAHFVYQSRLRWEELWSVWQKIKNWEYWFIRIMKILGFSLGIIFIFFGRN